MAQSLAKILLHTVFSSKDRRPFLRDEPFREELHRTLGGILTKLSNANPSSSAAWRMMCICSSRFPARRRWRMW